MLIVILIALPIGSNLLGFPPLRMSGGSTPLKVMGGYTQCYDYITRYDSVEEKKWIDETSKYNEKGNVLARTLIHINGDTMTKETFKYDNNDSCIEYIEYYVNEFPSKKIIIHKYDESGKKIGSIIYDGDVTKLIFKYDENGKQIEVNEVITEDSIITESIYKYNKNGNPIEEIFLYDDELWRNISKYNDKGNLIENILYEPDGSIYNKHCYYYDTEGNVIEETRLNSKGILTRITKLKYNDIGKLMESIEFDVQNSQHKKEVFKYHYKYDEFGNITEKLHYIDAKLNSKSEYIYSK